MSSHQLSVLTPAHICAEDDRVMPVVQVPSVSWWHVIVELERSGYYQRQIGAAIGSARGTVEGWKNKHAIPRHADGERLIALWTVVTGKKRKDLPVRPRETLSAGALR